MVFCSVVVVVVVIIHLSIYLSVYLSIYLSVCLSVCLSGYLQAWKRSYFATLPQFLNLTTSKTKQFCETSFKYGKLSAELTASYQCGVLRFFHSTCLNYCACREKVMPGHTKCCTCHAKSSQQTWRSEAPKCNPSREISALTPSRKMHLCRSSSIVRRLPSFLDMLQNHTKPVCFQQHQKTKQFCETSFKNGKLRAELTASYHCVLRFLLV